MTDEKFERVREKLDDALERERILRKAVEWYANPRNADGGVRAQAALKNA